MRSVAARPHGTASTSFQARCHSIFLFSLTIKLAVIHQGRDQLQQLQPRALFLRDSCSRAAFSQVNDSGILDIGSWIFFWN